MPVKNVKPCAFPNTLPNAANLPEEILDYVALHCPLSPRSMRLLYGIFLYTMSMGYSDLKKFLHATVYKMSPRIRCALLTELIGTDGVRDNRWIMKAVEELSKCERLFKEIRMEDSTTLVFKTARIFSDTMAMAKIDKEKPHYARVAPADFNFSSGYRIQANILMRQHVNKRWPLFRLPYIPESSPEVAVTEFREKSRNARDLPPIEEAIEEERKRRERVRIIEWSKSRNA